MFISSLILALGSCATSKVQESNEAGGENFDKIVQQTQIKQSVEMRRFIIKFDRLYYANGGRIDLVPKTNYIILDGERAIINAAYIGRQFSYRPIAGINMTGNTIVYERKDNSKGYYEIRLKVQNDANTFDVFLTINYDGYCNVSITNNRLDHIRYNGNFVPLKPREEEKPSEDTVI